MRKKLGVALDIGTTTVQGKLVDLKTKKELSSFSSLNEQLLHGHDIISRLRFCDQKPNGLERLHKDVISSINFIIENLVSTSREDLEDIDSIVCVGNAALYHFTLFLSPESLIKPPYEPEFKELVNKKANCLGVNSKRECDLCFLPNLGGFVGSDAIAVILAANIDKSSEPILAVDLGTNGEIILGSRDRILVASTAAGPAFEGWHVSCGMRAVDGAIERVKEEKGELKLSVIGEGEPKGFSGSGLIDIIAILLGRGYIRKSGKMEKDFIVRDNPKISLSCDDVRQVQLAKAAFGAGIERISEVFGKKVSKVVLTGNFGKSLDKKNAKTLGIIPRDIESRKITFLPDGALKGSEIFLAKRKAATTRIKSILKKTEHVSIGQDEGFLRSFVEAMRFL